MIRKYFHRCQEIGRKPSFLFILMLVLRNLLISWFGLPGNPINVSLFSSANHVAPGASPRASEHYPAIEILFVSTRKDFEILVHSIRAAQGSTNHHSGASVAVIVPDSEYEEACNLLFQEFKNVEVLCESEFLSSRQISDIRKRFGNRAGWVIQQLLKVEYVSRSQQMGVLIVDSDTILLRPRIWIDKLGAQLLTPTWEWHQPYYDFLENAGFGKGLIKQSFIPHHMLMQPKFLREARIFLGWQDLDFLIQHLILNCDARTESPFCIEFELYAQYMLQFHADKVILSKWSNIGIPRNPEGVSLQIEEIMNSFRDRFASVSLHAYL